MPYYGYVIDSENKSGVTDSWEKCKSIVAGYKARYKKFNTERDAETWIDQGGSYEKPVIELKKGIYFDAGTGRGIGVEVRVTDETGASLVANVVPAEKVNPYGNYTAAEGKTNNFGELLGCYIALKIAIENNIKKIFGDSKLVIDYWSKGHIKDTVGVETVKLAKQVAEIRGRYEALGGTIEHISGDINPADLGFHR